MRKELEEFSFLVSFSIKDNLWLWRMIIKTQSEHWCLQQRRWYPDHQNGHIISFRELQDILLVSALKIAQHFQKPIFTSTFHSPRFMIQHFENSEKKRAALGYILQPFFFFMSLLCIFYFVRVVPGPCANLSWFENHQKCLKVFWQSENAKLFSL